MKNQSTYKGTTTIHPDSLFEPTIKIKNPPVKSNKFGAPSLYYLGKYYFLGDLKPSTKQPGKPFEIQVVYYSHKWYQDTFYIDTELKELLERHA